MDGQPISQHKSLQRELTRWILLTAGLFVLLGGGIAGGVVFYQTQELQDDSLKEIAALVGSGQINETRRTRHGTLDEQHDEAGDGTIIIHRLGIAGHSPGTPPVIRDGLQTLTMDGEEWRVLAITRPGNRQRYAVAQQTELRDNIAWSSSLGVLLPTILLVGAMLLMIPIIIRRQFRPLARLAKALDQQDGTRPEMMPERSVPLEIVPFVRSIDELLARTRQAMHKQQRFIADAAHELRTPIAALSLQAENLARATSEAGRKERQQQLQLQQGLARLRRLVAQLLDLARLQSDHARPTQSVSFNRIVQNAIADLFPLAEAAELDLGVIRQEALSVTDQEGRLSQLVHNAIGNAIQYTPAGGRVDISLFRQSDKAVLLIEDSEIGIPEADLGKVMQPFYRVLATNQPGNGLGLAICREIAQRLDGEMSLSNRQGGGLCFRYEQPCGRLPDAVKSHR